jgi:hypothetical protein
VTDLQLGLLIIGVVAVGGVLIYNRIQERAAKRRVEQAFASRHGDALLDAEPHRREPVLSAAPRHTGLDEGVPPGALPDERFDYVMQLLPARPRSADEALQDWAGLEHRFAKRALLAAADERGWRRLLPGDSGPCSALRAGLQLASRDGAVSEAQLLDFRSEVETLGAKLGASVTAPEMRQAIEAARELDGLCAEADIQVALHVVAPEGTAFSEDAVRASVDSAEEVPFELEVQRGASTGIAAMTLTLDVPRVPDVVRSFEAMARTGRQLAAALDGRLVDDNRNPLDERSFAAIAVQLETVHARLSERGIEPGGELALRLFS